MCVWSCSPVMSTLCWCGPAAYGGRSLSRGPTLWPWSRRHRWPPAARHTGRSAPPPRGPWGRVNTDLSQCPRRAAWRHESHWPPWEETTKTASQVWVNSINSFCKLKFNSLHIFIHTLGSYIDRIMRQVWTSSFIPKTKRNLQHTFMFILEFTTTPI